MSSRERVLDHIRAERERQIAKYGDHRREAGTWALILNEETGEVARAAMERNPCVEADHQALYEELVHGCGRRRLGRTGARRHAGRWLGSAGTWP